MESEIYTAKFSLSDFEVSMNICNITRAIIYSIFLPLFLYYFLHIVISIFSTVQAWGITADDSWTRHQWQCITLCLLAKCYWLKSLALPQFTTAKCLVLLGFSWEMTFIVLIHILTLYNLVYVPKSPPLQGRTDLGMLKMAQVSGVNFIFWVLYLSLLRKLLKKAYNCRWGDNC